MRPWTFDELYREHQPWLLGWLRARLGHGGDRAPDLSHDTFERLLRGATPMQALGQPRAYLATVARGLLIDHFRRQDLEAAYLAELALRPEAEQPSPEARAQVLEQLMLIDRLLDGLPPKVRAAFVLAQIEDWPHERIAEHLGVSVSSVKKYVHRGLVQCLLAL